MIDWQIYLNHGNFNIAHDPITCQIQQVLVVLRCPQQCLFGECITELCAGGDGCVILICITFARMISELSTCRSTSRYCVWISDWCRLLYQLLISGYKVIPRANKNTSMAQAIVSFLRALEERRMDFGTFFGIKMSKSFPL